MSIQEAQRGLRIRLAPQAPLNSRKRWETGGRLPVSCTYIFSEEPLCAIHWFYPSPSLGRPVGDRYLLDRGGTDGASCPSSSGVGGRAECDGNREGPPPFWSLSTCITENWAEIP